MAVTLLDGDGRRRVGLVGGEAGEGVGAELIGEIVGAAAADVGNVHAEIYKMFAVGPGEDVGAVEMVFGAAGVGLCAAAGEKARHDNLRSVGDAGARLIVLPYQKTQLIDQCGGESVAVADIDFVFDHRRVISGFGKHVSADALIFVGAVFVGITDPEKIAVGEFMEDAAFAEEVAEGSCDIFVNGSGGVCN